MDYATAVQCAEYVEAQGADCCAVQLLSEAENTWEVVVNICTSSAEDEAKYGEYRPLFSIQKYTKLS